MKVIVPDYYKEFKCIADKCRHTCCRGWEVEVDDDSLKRFEAISEINEKIEHKEDNHFRLTEDEACPFLMDNGLCEMIIKYGEKMLCQTCTDHPRFRNYWSDRIEMGLGLVCEEAARLVLLKSHPMKLEILNEKIIAGATEYSDGENEGDDDNALPDDEAYLMNLREDMLKDIEEEGPLARLREYLIYRHIPDALYDDRLIERINFVDEIVDMVKQSWEKSDGSFEALVEIVRQYSYDIEYDEEEKERLLEEYSRKKITCWV